jgi:N utilization substance protein A
MKGMRVQSIIRELRGEKIDIIEYSDDPVVFATHALSPAKISRVSISNPGERHMEVIVDDTQLSLAIGKKGQNVRLASRLTNWRIDVRSEAEAEEETRRARQSINSIPGVGDFATELLYQSGFKSAEDVADSDLEEILDVDGISKEKAEALHASAKQYVAEKRAREAAEAAAAAEAAQIAAAAAPTEQESQPE